MGELIEGIINFGTELEGIITRIEEVAAALKNMAEIFDSLFDTKAAEEMFQNIEDKIKSIGPTLAAAFKQGKLEDLLGNAFEAAVERLGNLLFNPHFWSGLGTMLLAEFEMQEATIMKIILNIGIVLKTVLDKAFQDVYQGIGKIPGLGKALGLSDYKAESFSQIYQENLHNNAEANAFLGKFIGAGKILFVEGAKEFGKAISESGTGPAQAQFASQWHSLAPAPPKIDAPSPTHNVAPLNPRHPQHNDNPPANPEQSGRNEFRSHKPEFTSLEKMGFIMSGSKVHNPYDQRKIDLLQQIVHNTSQRVGLGWGASDPNHVIRDSLLQTYMPTHTI